MIIPCFPESKPIAALDLPDHAEGLTVTYENATQTLKVRPGHEEPNLEAGPAYLIPAASDPTDPHDRENRLRAKAVREALEILGDTVPLEHAPLGPRHAHNVSADSLLGQIRAHEEQDHVHRIRRHGTVFQFEYVEGV